MFYRWKKLEKWIKKIVQNEQYIYKNTSLFDKLF
jgi:hypothetical protein